MAGIELVTRILDLIASGSFSLTSHAKQRMNERSVTQDDIQQAARTSYYEEIQDQAKGKILFEGLDLDEEKLEVVAAYEAGVVIVSVF